MPFHPGRIALALSLLVPGFPALPSPLPRSDSSPPALIVLVVVDQMRPDYFTRYRAQFTGGLGWLWRHGAVFLNARQNHALTQTAPGHATLLSGRPPASTGIYANAMDVIDSLSPVIGAPDAPGASPRAFRGSELYDWLLARDSGSEALGVSRKDRAAILPIGRARANVFWYWKGSFTTSRWYADSLPDWARGWNGRGGAERLAGTEWRLLLPDSAYEEPDSETWEADGKDIVFPHRLPDAPAIASKIEDFPWMDSLTLDFALQGANALRLGRRGHTDLLVVSLSTTDEIGHRFGPDSREIHDQVLRLDRWLGWFLDSLGTLVPRNRTVLALSADHGTQHMPEYTEAVLHRPAGRAWVRDLAPELRREFEPRFRTRFGFSFQYGVMLAGTRELRARGVNVDSLSAAVAARLAVVPGMERTYTPRTLARAPRTDQYAERWKRQLPPDLGWLAIGVLKPGWIWSGGRSSNHGTPQLDDVRVPLIIAAPGVPAGIHTRPVPITDLAPTLARLAGVTPTQPLDGVPLPEVVEDRGK